MTLIIGANVSEDNSHNSREEQEECISLHVVGVFLG
jgi:hypothetical protein